MYIYKSVSDLYQFKSFPKYFAFDAVYNIMELIVISPGLLATKTFHCKNE